MLPLVAFIAAVAQQGEVPTPAQHQTIYAELAAIEADPARTANVEAFVLRRETAELILQSGQLSLLTPVGGNVVGAVFSGDALFRMAPPLQIERDHLVRVLDSERVMSGTATVELEGALLLFSGETLDELTSALTFGSTTPVRDARKNVEEGLKFLLDKDARDADAGLMNLLLNGAGDFVHMHLRARDGRPLFFRVDGSEREEVSFGAEARGRGDYYETLVQHHRPDDYTTGRMLTEREPQLASLEHYRIESKIERRLGFSARAQVRVVPTADGGLWLPLRLYSELDVDSVGWRVGEDGPTSAAVYYRTDESGRLWVRLPDESSAGTPLHLVVDYEGDLLRQESGWVSLASSAGWYPRYGSEPATFDLSFQTHKHWKFAGSGVRESRTEEGDWVLTRWRVDQPALHASFNVGEFTEHLIEHDGIPALTLQYAERAHARLSSDLAERGYHLLEQEDMGQAVGFDIGNSYRFFQEVYGPLPAESFYATEIPAGHGQAFPGMIHLSWSTFQWTGEKGYDQIFRAHEVAHQWWGLSVEPDSYHDVWLSEGLSEFSGLWYMGVVQMNPPLYFARLNDYKKNILERRDNAAPVWLGRRVVTSTERETRRDYQTIIYEKGAWVFHMLRNLMMDLDTMNEDAFKNMMRDAYQRGQGKTLSTQEFSAIVQEHIGADMGWFFRQWVYGSDVPTYCFSYTGEQTAEGYRMRGRVVTDRVSDDFQAITPVYIGFGEDGWARIRVSVQGPVTELDFPMMPRASEIVRFNDLESVLAEVIEEDWRDDPSQSRCAR